MSYLCYPSSFLTSTGIDGRGLSLSLCLRVCRFAKWQPATDRCANCGFKMTAFGRPPFWSVMFYSLGGFNSQARPVSLWSQKCGSYVIDSSKGDGGGGGQDGKDRRGRACSICCSHFIMQSKKLPYFHSWTTRTRTPCRTAAYRIRG